MAYVMSFASEEEAVDLVNRSQYGLANSVWSADLERANRGGGPGWWRATPGSTGTTSSSMACPTADAT